VQTFKKIDPLVMTSVYTYVLYDEHQKKAIFGTKLVNSGKDGEEHKIKQTISFHVLT
jgi:hypothetical protein